LLVSPIDEGQRHVLESFMNTAGYACRCAKELGIAGNAGQWANAAMGWFMEEAVGGRLNEVLLRAAGEFADDMRGNVKVLLQGGLDERVWERFLKVLEAGSAA
jgi:hypothetical protein